jgi:ribosomal RNA assembly protein
VEDCIRNVHPIYHIKTLMIKRELAKDPALKEENWQRFLPNFKKKNVQRKKPKKVRHARSVGVQRCGLIWVGLSTGAGCNTWLAAPHPAAMCQSHHRCPCVWLPSNTASSLCTSSHCPALHTTHALQVREKRVYTPFPPPMPPSKEDLMLESGEYFLSNEQKAARAAAALETRQAARVEERQRQREAAFQAPAEGRAAGGAAAQQQQQQQQGAQQQQGQETSASMAAALKKKLKGKRVRCGSSACVCS